MKIIISGGQTGVDIAALEFAKSNGFKTGGIAPKNFRTEVGNKPEYKELYNMIEDTSYNYKDRTILNVKNSDFTLIFGNTSSTGSKLTIRNCQKYDKKYLAINPFIDYYNPIKTAIAIRNDKYFINAKIVNIAGNRESISPGIGIKLKQLLTLVFE